MKFTLYDKVRLKSIAKDAVYIGPKNVNIHITNVCNFNCLFCWYHSPFVSYNADKKEMDFEAFKKVIYDCKDMHVEKIILEGDGEIFLHPFAEQMITLIKSQGLKLEIYTNGFFDEKFLKVLKGVDFNINLSAATSETHIVLQSGGKKAFFKILKNILFLKSRGSRIHLTYIITEKNYHEIKKMVELAKKLKADYLEFKLITATKELQHLIPSPSSIKKMKKDISSILSSSSEVFHNLSEILRIITSPDFNKHPYWIPRSVFHNDRYFYYSQQHFTACYVPWFYSFIDVDGNVIAPCDNIGMSIVGNIYEKSFKEIWFSKKYQKIRLKAKYEFDPKKRIWEECKYCGYTLFNKEIERGVELYGCE